MRIASETWLADFEAALSSRDAGRIGALFHDDCHWRDVMAFTWDFSSERGRADVAGGLAAAQETTRAEGLHLPAGRKAPRQVKRVGRDCIEAIFEFKTAIGSGSGIFRLIPEAETGAMKAWHVSTILEELEGHPERIGKNRPTGAAYSRNFGGDNWLEVRQKAVAYADREPTVLVIGAAQAGLSVAARLGAIGVDTLVAERWPRIGDSWRRRYHSLALHNSTHINHLPFMEFPPTYPTYIPKDMLGNWFEMYAEAMEINCWTNSELVSARWDEDSGRWEAVLNRGEDGLRTVRPRHIILANGTSSYPKVPDLPGLSDFEGEVIHAEGFDTGAKWAGKRALIIGTGTSANDIALDLHSFGVNTTMVQRGSTTVVSINPSARLNEAIYNEGPPMADNDLIATSASPALQADAYRLVVKRMLELDHDMIEGLKRIGFKFDIGHDETGHQMKYYRRGGGYNLDAGSSELLIKGEIGLLDYDRIESFSPEGARLKDGSTVPADVIVLATGYLGQSELVRRTMGQAVVDRLGPVWGLGEDGELNNICRRTPQKNLWFIAGGLSHARIRSRYLALQILATELGLLGPLRP
ncbi:hypothetical protein ATO6_21615 [Oceanicola sp. 22II-s10i]|nr:hypothetical protein ATO6_21615 [Oceanicola sp. 22II-s10i]